MRQGLLCRLGAGLLLGFLVEMLPAGEILTNAEVTEMVKSGLGETIIREKIATSENIFDISAKALIDLKKNAVPETLIQLMHQEALKNQKRLRARIASEIQNLVAENELCRRGAEAYLKKVGSAALPQLREALNANPENVQEALIDILSKMNDRDSAPLLRELLVSQSHRLRIAAAAALTALADETSVKLARQAVKQGDGRLDGYMRLLGGMKDSASVSALAVCLLRAFAPESRAEAAWALGEIQAQAGVSTLETALVNDNEIAVKANAAEALGKIAAEESFARLTDACRNMPAVRQQALAAIGRYPAKLSVPFLVGALAQPLKAEEKQVALKALRAQTGRDFGTDMAAWNRWMAENLAPAAQAEAETPAAPGTEAKPETPAAPAETPAEGQTPADK